MSYKIVIVDDHLLIAEALESIIDKFRKYEVLYLVGNGKALMERFTQPINVPDIVLLDIKMPIMDGFETARWLTQHHPQVRILALSMQDDEESLIKMIRSGAKGYLLKNIYSSELELALDDLVTKGLYYPEWATHKVLRSLSADPVDDPTPAFNKRELEFLQLASTEMTYKEIAEKMICSVRTVEGYRDNLFEKLEVNPASDWSSML